VVCPCLVSDNVSNRITLGNKIYGKINNHLFISQFQNKKLHIECGTFYGSISSLKHVN
jgi:acetone carboxylase gamma subunit